MHSRLAKTRRAALSTRDVHHIAAAKHWLSLGNLEEAVQELRKVGRHSRAHPDVVKTFREIVKVRFGW